MNNKTKFLITFLIALLLFILCLLLIDNEQIPPLNNVALNKLIYGMQNPNWSIYLEQQHYIIETIAIALLGTIFSVLIAFPIALKSSYKLNDNFKKWNGISPFLRIFPDLLVGMFIVAIVGPGSWAGVLTICIVSCGPTIKFYKELFNKNHHEMYYAADKIIKNNKMSHWIALIGFNSNEIISITLTRLETNLRIAVVIGFVGAGGVGNVLIHSIQTYDFATAFALIYVLIIMFVTLDYLSIYWRKKLT